MALSWNQKPQLNFSAARVCSLVVIAFSLSSQAATSILCKDVLSTNGAQEIGSYQGSGNGSSQNIIIRGNDLSQRAIIKGPTRYNFVSNWGWIERVRGITSKWSADGSFFAVLFTATGGHMTPAAELGKIQIFSAKTAEKVQEWNIENGQNIVLPSSRPDLLITQFDKPEEGKYLSYDERNNPNTVTVISEIFDINTGKKIATIPHELGWKRFKPRVLFSYLDTNSTYYPRFKIIWSKSGQFFADVDGDTVKVYEVDLTTFKTNLLQTASLQQIVSSTQNTLGLFASPATKFEREVATP
jgi:hypothetical protein